MNKIILIISFLSTFLFANSSIAIHGTSTLHDWVMASERIDTIFETDGSKITRLNVAVKIKTLKSGDDGLDEKAYETLKIDRNNFITFEFSEANLKNGTIKGTFKVLDKKQITVLKPEVLSLNHIKGSFSVKMTDFGLEIPSVMFGAIKAGDEVTVKYNIKK